MAGQGQPMRGACRGSRLAERPEASPHLRLPARCTGTIYVLPASKLPYVTPSKSLLDSSVQLFPTKGECLPVAR